MTDAMNDIRDSILGAKKAVDSLNGEDVDVDAEGEDEVDDLKDKLLSAARAAGRLDGKTVEIEAEVDTDRARQALSSLRGGDADISGTSSPSSSRRRGTFRLPGELDEVRETFVAFRSLSPKVQALGGALVAAAAALGAAGGLAAAATALANRFGSADIRQDLAKLKQRFRSLGATFADAFEPIIRQTIIPAGVSLAESLKDAIPQLKEFAENNLPTLAGSVDGLVTAVVKTIQALGVVTKALGILASAVQGIAKIPGLTDLFSEENPFEGVRKEFIDILQGFGFGGEQIGTFEVPQSEISTILQDLRSGDKSVLGDQGITSPQKIKELQTELEKARIKFKELGVTSKREFLQALVTIREKGVDALAAVQARTGEVPDQLSKWSKELKKAQKRLDDFAITAEDLDLPEVDLSGAGGPVEPPNPPEVVPPGEVTGAPSATFGGALPPLERIRTKIRQSVQGLSQVQQVGVGAFRSLGNSVGRVVGQIVTLSDRIKSAGDAFRSLGRAAVRIVQQVITKLASAAALAAILGPLLGISSAGFGSIFKGVLSSGGIPGLAQGGIVTGPTLGVIGEGREDEAILPLSKLNSMMSAVAQTASVGTPKSAARVGVRQGGPSSTSIEGDTLNVDIPVEAIRTSDRIGQSNLARAGRA
ncbi:hypothetical protein [Salinibacter ruber]|uniref:Tail tape measure protein n=1 Tax=Salinibacter ruber TaxID=146919 RepID=A0A9X2TLP5_9BACT|nr:hypothetical protein [Salinibacter ruber]MCS3662333.1 hypothetical protein [Salinibacter ruber]MCS3712138.1 hypothetical protein [Salinibacter ruber]